MIFETFRQAIQNVWSNKLRTFLTMLGIIIGVMAVIVIVGLGNGMTKSMRDSFSALGTNTLSIQVWGYGSRSVSVEEMYDICQRHSDLIKAVSPQVNFSGKASGTLKIGTTSYRWSNMSGVDENFTEMKNYQIVQGRGLQYMDMQDNKQVCVIGDYLNRVAFGGNGVGQTLKIGANKFRVVGVLSAKVSDPTMQQGSDDDCVYLPYTTVMRLSSQSMVDCYTAMMGGSFRSLIPGLFSGFSCISRSSASLGSSWGYPLCFFSFMVRTLLICWLSPLLYHPRPPPSTPVSPEYTCIRHPFVIQCQAGVKISQTSPKTSCKRYRNGVQWIPSRIVPAEPKSIGAARPPK